MKRKYLVIGALAIASLASIGFLVWPKQPPKITRPPPRPSPTPLPEKITLAAVGDISLSRAVNWQIQKREDPTFPFQKTATIFQEADLGLGNLEGPLVANCPLTQMGMVFCGQPKNAAGLAWAGFDLINLANNHIHNYGPKGIEQTINALSQHQIDYFGLEKISYQTIKGTTIAFLGFDDTLRPIKKEELTLIQEAKTKADLVIINFHWGIEYQKKPNQRQKYLARLAIESGADLIIGHHPHVLQPLEFYQEKPIFYSLANFVFDQPWSQETRTGAIALITIINGQIEKTELLTILIEDDYQPALIQSPLPIP